MKTGIWGTTEHNSIHQIFKGYEMYELRPLSEELIQGKGGERETFSSA